MAGFGKANLRKTENLRDDLEDYSFDLERRLRHYLRNISLSSINLQITTLTDTATLSVTQVGMVVCNKATAMTVNLPTITGNKGLRYGIVNIGAGTVTIDPSGAETIVGDATFNLYTDESLTIFATEDEWREGGV